jgi:hydrogenase maturation protease
MTGRHARTSTADAVVGGVAHLYQGDLDFGRRVVEVLAHDNLGPGVVVEEFSYGAVAVAQRLQELHPALLVLVGAKERGREPGKVERREITPLPRPAEELQAAVADAVTGYIDVDLVLEVAQALGALPGRTVTIEVEPATTEPCEHLSPSAEAALADVVDLVREELS